VTTATDAAGVGVGAMLGDTETEGPGVTPTDDDGLGLVAAEVHATTISEIAARPITIGPERRGIG
jgi:hypothetical protein